MSLKVKVKGEQDKINAITHIRDILSSIILSNIRNDFEYTKNIIPVIKELLNDMVDDIWKFGERSFLEISQRKKSPLSDEYVGSSKSNLRGLSQDCSIDKINHKQYSNFPMQKTFDANDNRYVSPLRHGKGKFYDVISEFSYGKGPTFSKSIRETDRTPSVTPGPACYDYVKADVKASRPKISFPSVSKRDSYVPTTYSPGPGKYYSSMHFVSKH